MEPGEGMESNPIIIFILNVIKKEIIPTELICYPIVTSATILEIVSAFRIVDYYYQFFWPKVLMIYTPIFLAALVCLYFFYIKNAVKLIALISALILVKVLFEVANELNEFSSPPKIFFENYIIVILILFVTWLFVTWINEFLKKKVIEFKKEQS